MAEWCAAENAADDSDVERCPWYTKRNEGVTQTVHVTCVLFYN